MSYHPRIESAEIASFLTTRCRQSELWFANNRSVEESILGYLARYVTRYEVKLYAFAIEGNHTHFPAHFPGMNRGSFMRDLNSNIARSVARLTPHYTGGRLFGRRHSTEFLPHSDDIEHYFFYTVLQPIKDGLVENLSDYPGYNCFQDAIWGRTRKYKVINWGAYNAARRYNRKISIEDFTEHVKLTYARLPGYEHLSQREYAALMTEKFEERRRAIVEERRRQGLGFVGKRALMRVQPGSLPRDTKTSTRFTHRPRVLAICPKRYVEYLTWYFEIYSSYREASHLYRRGHILAEFPHGTYKPYVATHPPNLRLAA